MATVLVVEDEDITRLMLEARLHRAGHRVRMAGSLEEAHAVMARPFTPQVLITDLFMPGGSGLSLVSALRADPDWADLPVIFLSGRALPGDVEAARALGGTYLTKPFSMAALAAAIDEAVRSRPGADGPDPDEDGGDPDSPEERALFARLLTAFVDRAPESVAAVERALDSGDDAAVEAALHRLRGSAATLGAGELARLCEDLEARARAGGISSPAAVGAALRRELDRTCRVFAELARELAEDVPATA